MTHAGNNRIVHVPRRFVAEEWGGTETVILEISRQQQRAGGRPVILTSMALATRREEEIGGVPVRRFSYSYPFLGLSRADRAAMDKKGGNLLSFSLFSSLLTQPEVRLFHAHALKRLGGEVRTAARLRRKPFVVSLHGGVFDVPAAEREQMLKPIANKPEWGKVFGALFGSRRILEDADQVICVGQSEMEKAKGQLGHDRIAYLPNGVDCAKFAVGDGAAFRARHAIPAGAFLVLNVSRLDAQKNQRLLLEAFARLLEAQPDAFLVLIGPETQPDYAAGLREFVAANGLARRVQILPGLRNDSPDLANAYHACDVFVLPSMHEPFGIVVLEAWSAGRPVIVSHVGGLKALVRDGETGLFISKAADASAEDLAGQLRVLCGSPALRQKLGVAGREEALLRYDWTRIGQQLEQLYQAAEQQAGHRYGRNGT
ncbi:MAG: glycosyltransferase family 4 protein [Verrucomicrobiota bacterium]